MADQHTQFDGSIPEKYDEHLGPLLFEFYARDLARRVTVPAGGRVLEIACGTGISTAFLREALPDSIEIVATDLNKAMLDVAYAKRGDLANVRYQPADAMDLPFGDQDFDAVVCQFGLMFLPDKPAGMHEAARTLKPGGLFAFNVWDSHDRNPIARIAHETIGSFFVEDPPMFLMIPFSFHDIDSIKDLLAGAGFAGIDVNVIPTVVERPSARHVAIGLVEGTPGIHEVHERATASPNQVVDAVAEELRDAFGDAPLRAPLQAIVITALRPGG